MTSEVFRLPTVVAASHHARHDVHCSDVIARGFMAIFSSLDLI
jgi:hypothetical protein